VVLGDGDATLAPPRVRRGPWPAWLAAAAALALGPLALWWRRRAAAG
jgi:hypothetical protein